MGWTTVGKKCSKNDIIAECLNSVALTCIDKSVQGSELWVVWERKTDKHRFISVYLIESDHGSWAYKEIIESEGPWHYKCPLAFLALAPEANHSWRTKVIQYHEKKLSTKELFRIIEIGDIVALDSINNTFRVTSKSPFLGARIADNKTYHLVRDRVIAVI